MAVTFTLFAGGTIDISVNDIYDIIRNATFSVLTTRSHGSFAIVLS
ncbi:hypothetical protein J2736_006704 [Paenibacillus qinlingensis]|uniref:Uncharacterized protein n=1 Tax=Paenibacillus qinlingensis TaxID=1837343 RepID=A0ABU1P8S1_9BACL|nr:hypothetical protein [Paenibacillus qinlingensis]